MDGKQVSKDVAIYQLSLFLYYIYWREVENCDLNDLNSGLCCWIFGFYACSCSDQSGNQPVRHYIGPQCDLDKYHIVCPHLSP